MSKFKTSDKSLYSASIVHRNEKAILAMEKKHLIKERWSDWSRVFLTVKSRLYEKRKSELLLKLHCMASERCFLVELKRKYAGNVLEKLLLKIFSSMCALMIRVCSKTCAFLMLRRTHLVLGFSFTLSIVCNCDSRHCA